MRERVAWRQWLQRWRTRRREPAAALFRGLRLRLTLWYSGVLAVSLLLAGVGLYLGLERLILRPITSDVDHQVAALAQEWARDGSPPCRLHGPAPFLRGSSPVPFYFACFDARANLFGLTASLDERDLEPPDAFLDSSLARRALTRGVVADRVDGGDDVGALYRAARVVRDPLTGSVVGVVQVGRSIEEQRAALRALR
ncbi:MAG: hypothetical protein IRY97_06685, partial [Thermomicrobiaceae bacterium]|nr:hypothetical protein [Thermomicrobiaceae bacterium]